MMEKRLKLYFAEASGHIDKIKRANAVLAGVMPMNEEALESLPEAAQDKLDILAFRFSKLQDILGDKIFRMILEYSGFNVQRPFIELLGELEREGLLDLDLWIELRNARNKIAHEYPYDSEKLVSAINFIYSHSDYLIELTQKLEEYFYAIKNRRNR